MQRKIEVNETIEYDDTRLDLYVDYQDPTKFIFTDKSVNPLLVFTCDHESEADIQRKVKEVMTIALQEWHRLHKAQDQRNRIALLATDKNVNIIIDNTRKYGV